MALQNRDLGGSEEAYPESSPRLNPRHTKVIKLVAHASADTLWAVGTPLIEVAASPGTYDVWTNAAGQPIVAFLFPEARTQLAAGELLVVAMTAGDVHRDAVPLPSGETQGNLDAALKANTLKTRDLLVQGLAGVSI